MKLITINDVKNRFELELLAGGGQLDQPIAKSRVNRPGLEFAGYFEFFSHAHVQILGQKEINYLRTLPEVEQKDRITNILRYRPPCFIITRNQEAPENLIRSCEEGGIPLLRAPDATSKFIERIEDYLAKQLAPEITVHGVCVNVSGIGILLRGASGSGKSETAHTLIRRGHRLVADDAVVLKKINPETIVGTHDGKTREFLALRSIGLINVSRLYGRKAFQDETPIVLDIELTKWDDQSPHNELEVRATETEYLDVRIPHFAIQLQPGRDVAGLVEAAANNWYLRQQGYNAVEDFMKRLESES